MLQTESPYYQPTPPPPAPFTAVVGGFPGDPNYTCNAGDEFSGCDDSWAVVITGSENIFVASAGLYSVSDRDALPSRLYDADDDLKPSSGSRPMPKVASIHSCAKRR